MDQLRWELLDDEIIMGCAYCNRPAEWKLTVVNDYGVPPVGTIPVGRENAYYYFCAAHARGQQRDLNRRGGSLEGVEP